MNIAAVNPIAKAGDLPLEKLAGNKSLSETDKVAEVSRQFESVLLRQILGAARKTIFKSKFNEDSMASGIYQDMTTGQLADAISRNGSFGLARSLEAQLIRQNGVRPSPGAESREPSSGLGITDATSRSDVAAGEDARTPQPSPSAAEAITKRL